MLRTNLSTRPFYNVRLVQLALVAAAIVVVAFALVNLSQYRSLSAHETQLANRLQGSLTRAAHLRRDAAQARAGVDRKQLELVAVAAREANALIDRRIFSWTELLNRLEITLPDAVKVQAIRPTADADGDLTVDLLIQGHKEEDVEAFIEQLQKTGAFQGLYTRSQTTTPAGLLEISLVGRYVPGAPGAVKAAAAGPAPATAKAEAAAKGPESVSPAARGVKPSAPSRGREE
jgi:hypothetical protein